MLPSTQGSRLTAFELAFEGIPSCLICDDMAGALMNGKGNVGGVDAVVVGADRGASTYNIRKKCYFLSLLLGLGPFGPGPVWAQARLGLGPFVP